MSLSKTHLCCGWSSAVWSRPSHWAHGAPSLTAQQAVWSRPSHWAHSTPSLTAQQSVWSRPSHWAHSTPSLTAQQEPYKKGLFSNEKYWRIFILNWHGRYPPPLPPVPTEKAFWFPWTLNTMFIYLRILFLAKLPKDWAICRRKTSERQESGPLTGGKLQKDWAIGRMETWERRIGHWQNENFRKTLVERKLQKDRRVGHWQNENFRKKER